MKLIHSGFDKLVFAVRGAAKPSTIQHLDLYKEQAVLEQRDISVPFEGDSGTRKGIISQTGAKGGYTYLLNFDDVLGHFICIKKNLSLNQWNAHVTINALALAVFGWEEAVARVFSDLAIIGFSDNGVSLNRIDYAMDFLNAGIVLDPNHFVAHSRVKKAAHKLELNGYFRGQSCESVTLGSRSNRQIIIYDKLREVTDKHKPAWFKIWNLDRKDVTQTVHRAEIRLGKNELLKREIRTFDDLRNKLIAAMSHAARVIRYVTPREADQNISRWPNHPLWDHVQTHIREHVLRNPNYVDPDPVKQVIREQKAIESKKQVLGNMANLSVFEDFDPENLKNEMMKLMKSELSHITSDPEHRFWKSRTKTQDKFMFLSQEPS